MARLPVIEERDNAPCPKANGTTIGTDQQFILLCGSDVVGDVLDRPDADDFGSCVDLCASHHPKCEAVSFNKRKCELRAHLKAERTHPSKFTDAAVGQFPGTSSNCAGLGGSQVVQPNGVNFGTFCNFIIDGKDMAQNFAATFQDCMGQCASATGCNAVSYDASMSQGFKNCYMKTGVTTADNIANQGIDTAIVQNNAAVAAPAPAPSSVAPAPSPATPAPSPATPAPSPATPSPVQPTTASTLTPVTQAPATAGGASFFTPPGAGSPATTAPAAPAPVSVATETVISIITSVSLSDAVSVTQLITIPVTTEITATGAALLPSSVAENASPDASSASVSDPSAAQLGGDPGGAAPPQPDPSSSRAWIAAPVVGSIAALVVVVIAFVMLGRRRMARSRPGTARTTTSMESGESGGGLFTTWLPGSPRFRNRIMGATGFGAGSSMGNFSSVTGTAAVPQLAMGGGMRESGRSSILGGGLMGSGKGERLEDVEEGSDAFGAREKRAEGKANEVTPVYEVRNGKMELRESLNGLNGLSQNRWSERNKITEYVYW